MKVEWSFDDQCMWANIGDFMDNSSNRIMIYAKAGLFVAQIHETEDGYWVQGPVKTDASLIELMNWAEEELKFRESHGD